MKLRLLTHTPALETMIAVAMLTTTSGAAPSTLFNRLIENPDKTIDVVRRLEAQHGSILEHNRLNWVIEAEEKEVLNILLRSRFYTFTLLGSREWLVSANLRAVLEYLKEGDTFSELLFESIKDVSPTIYAQGRRGS